MANDQFPMDAPNRDEDALRLKVWKARKLRPIKAHLRGEWLQKYERLIADVGEQETRPSITFGPVTAFYRRDKSPIERDDLANMAPPQAIEYIASWAPNFQEEDGTVEGLAQVWTVAVAEQVTLYSKYAAYVWEQRLRPTYVYHFLQGLAAGVKTSGGFQGFDWNSILLLARDVCAPDFYANAGIENTMDGHLKGIRRELLDILEMGLRAPNYALPYDLREKAWEAIDALTFDPEPDRAYEKEYGTPNMEPVVMSINTVRGKAYHCVVHYALWDDHHRNTGKPDDLRERFLPPGTKAALTRILEYEETATVWSVLGVHLNIIAMLDPEWLSANQSTLTSDDSIRLIHIDALFEGYFSFAEPYGQMYRRFRGFLEAALKWALLEPAERSHYQPRDRFVQHLMVYYWWGLEHFDDTDSLINKFFSRASAELRAAAINFIGRSLENIAPDQPRANDVYEKLMALYDWRLSVAEVSGKVDETASELREFGWWVANGRLDSEWLMTRLLKTLTITGGQLEWAEAALERLPEYSSSHCELVAEILNRIIEGDRTGYNLRYWVPQFRKVMEGIKSCSSPEAISVMRKAINKLAAKEGIHELRDML